MPSNRKRVREIDRGYDKFRRRMMKIKRDRPHVAVGLVGERAWKPKESPDGYAEATVVDVGTFLEFGTRKMPARSFLRTTYEERKKAFFDFIRQAKLSMTAGRTSPEVILKLVGTFAQKEIRAKITRGDPSWPPLADSTIENKGSSKPLIDTGQLRQAIDYEVRNGN